MLQIEPAIVLLTGLPVWLFLSQISQFCLFERRLAKKISVWLILNFWLIFGFFQEKHRKQKSAYAMLVNFEIVHLYVIVPLIVPCQTVKELEPKTFYFLFW